MSIIIFMDSGAPSLYNKLSRKIHATSKPSKFRVPGAHIRNRGRDDFSYVETPEYLAYKEDYIRHLLENPHIDTYANLDVINNAELTYQNQKWFEERGVKPAPVWHFSAKQENVAWLRRYLEEGYKYICIGGMVPNSKAVLRPALNKLWREELTDDAGFPLVKVHGFAMTSFELMYTYPWYSVDSKSWVDTAKFGGILVPPLKHGKRDWKFPRKMMLTPRSAQAHADTHHFWRTDEGTRRGVLRYLEEINIPFGTSHFRAVKQTHKLKDGEVWVVDPKKKFPKIPDHLRVMCTATRPGLVEVVETMGCSNTYYIRLAVNVECYRAIERVIEEEKGPWPWALDPRIKRGRVGLVT